MHLINLKSILLLNNIENKIKDLSIYIHWPFCSKKCPYCDFNSHASDRAINYKDWEKAYKHEIQIEQYRLGKKNIKSIFFGGGTPSLMPSSLIESIILNISRKWNVTKNTEITVEANPSSFEIRNFINLAKSGVNRISLGLQSLNDTSLKFLGRNHNVKDGLKALESAKKYFNRVSFDLIYGLPGQNESSWELELKKAIKLSGEHMSAYQLTIEKGTPFYALHRDKKIILPKEKTLFNLYNITDVLLREARLIKYEVSNYSLKNSESIHNVKIWEGSEYCGIGPGAHGRIKIKNKWRATYRNPSPKIWLTNNLEKKSSLYRDDKITSLERAQEILLTNLRLTKGLKIKALLKIANADKIESFLNLDNCEMLKDQGFIEMNSSIIKITDKGFPVLNSLLSKIIL